MGCQQSLQEEGSDDSNVITLGQLIGRADVWFNKKLLEALDASEHQGFSKSDIMMLANLNCGRTYPSELARRIGVSRQAVYKLLKNLERKGVILLEQDTERKNSKVIVITEEGGRMIGDAVRILRGIEDQLKTVLGSKAVNQLREVLDCDWE